MKNDPICECRLSDGKICRYDACSPKRDAYDDDPFDFIGTGYIYRINGVQQTGEDELYFFRRRKHTEVKLG